MPKNKRDELKEDDFFGFTKSYLSKAFLNPQRIGCPAESDLQRMAEHPGEVRDAEFSKHLTCCSPCFNRYMQILAELTAVQISRNRGAGVGKIAAFSSSRGGLRFEVGISAVQVA